jgi:hypothetical protein
VPHQFVSLLVNVFVYLTFLIHKWIGTHHKVLFVRFELGDVKKIKNINSAYI